MGRLKELFTKLTSGFGNLSKGRKIALGILLLGIIAATIIGVYTVGKTNYVALFDSVDSKDSKNILAQLDEKKVSYKVVDNKIMVPEDVAGELRLSLSADITNGSIGFDIFDSSSQFGMTNEEFRVKYQRAIQGELEKTIKLYNEVENAKVNIVLPEDTTFVKDSAEASATVAIQLKQGVELDEEQVKGIISLVSFSVKNLPKKNVQVVDSNMRLLSEGLADESGVISASGSVDKQLEAKAKVDKQLENKVLDQLEPIYGKGRIKVNVNAVLDFDASKTETVTVDKDPAVVSEHTVKDSSGSSNGTTSNSPVDNNMSNVTTDTTNNGNSTREEVTKNYRTDGKTTENTVSAPGKIKRVTASVAIDSKDLDAATLEQIKELVNGTIGQINGNEDDTKVQSYDFNPTLKESVQSDFEKMQSEQEQANKMRLYLLIGLGIGTLLLSIIIFIVIRRRRKVVPKEVAEETQGIDAIISDIPPKQPISFAPIDFEEKNERTHLEEEIRKYATSKPDQVLDIIKSWMANDER
ncbi:MAG: flagellar basal-body MS-ring/collar protein FliF [Clostridiaceae bacterium]